MLYCQRIEHEDNRVPSDIPILFQHRDGPILPTLKWIHPFCYDTPKENERNNSNTENDASNPSSPPSAVPFTYVQVDAGAIPYLLGGANIMCPGLTKPNGSSYMTPDDNENDIPGLSKGQGVIIYAEHKRYPIAVGVMTMSSLEMYVSIVVLVCSYCVVDALDAHLDYFGIVVFYMYLY
jgi:malignant T-cell-amplified sequence